VHNVKSIHIQSKLHWVNIRDGLVKFYFKTIVVKEAYKNIHALKMVYGRVTNIEDMKQEFVVHYHIVF
jgi:hypothetical protein